MPARECEVQPHCLPTLLERTKAYANPLSNTLNLGVQIRRRHWLLRDYCSSSDDDSSQCAAITTSPSKRLISKYVRNAGLLHSPACRMTANDAPVNVTKAQAPHATTNTYQNTGDPAHARASDHASCNLLQMASPTPTDTSAELQVPSVQ